jgi:SWIM zinc finger
MDATLSRMVTHLPAIVTTLTAAHPASACRIERGAALVAAGAVERVYNVYLVTSASTPDRAYGVIRLGTLLTCDCPDYRERGGPCKHGWAVVCFEAAERLDAEEHDPTLQPIGYTLTARGLVASTDPYTECADCGDDAVYHDGAAGACTRQGVDAEGLYWCDCSAFTLGDDAA